MTKYWKALCEKERLGEMFTIRRRSYEVAEAEEHTLPNEMDTRDIHIEFFDEEGWLLFPAFTYDGETIRFSGTGVLIKFPPGDPEVGVVRRVVVTS